MTDRIQQVHLYIDRTRSLIKYVGVPKPPYEEFVEAMWLFAKSVQAVQASGTYIGKDLSHAAKRHKVMSMTRNAIMHVKSATGMELELHTHDVSSNDFDDAELLSNMQDNLPRDSAPIPKSINVAKFVESHFPQEESKRYAIPAEPYVPYAAYEGSPLSEEEAERQTLLILLGEVLDNADMNDVLREKIAKKIGRKKKD